MRDDVAATAPVALLLGRSLNPNRPEEAAAEVIQACTRRLRVERWAARARANATRNEPLPPRPSTSRSLDADGDGKISVAEMFDADGDGKVGAAEIAAGTFAAPRNKWQHKLKLDALKKAAKEQIKSEAAKLAEESAKAMAATEGKAEWWQQGDAAMNTAEVWALRLKLRQHKLVLHQLEDSCNIVMGGTSTTSIGYDRYVELQVRIYKALVKRFSMKDAKKCAKDDWVNDCKGDSSKGLTREALKDSLFEMADVWCETIDPLEYAVFLQTVFDAISGGDPPELLPLDQISKVKLKKTGELGKGDAAVLAGLSAVQRRAYQALNDAEKALFANLSDAERAAFLAMSAAERAAFMSMSDAERAAFLALSDAERALYMSMSDAERALFMGMTDEERAAYLAMSPEERKRWLAERRRRKKGEPELDDEAKFRLALARLPSLLETLYGEEHPTAWELAAAEARRLAPPQVRVSRLDSSRLGHKRWTHTWTACPRPETSDATASIFTRRIEGAMRHRRPLSSPSLDVNFGTTILSPRPGSRPSSPVLYMNAPEGSSLPLRPESVMTNSSQTSPSPQSPTRPATVTGRPSPPIHKWRGSPARDGAWQPPPSSPSPPPKLALRSPSLSPPPRWQTTSPPAASRPASARLKQVSPRTSPTPGVPKVFAPIAQRPSALRISVDSIELSDISPWTTD